MATAAAELTHAGIRGETWRELHPGGRVLIDVITAAIDGCDAVVAEISTNTVQLDRDGLIGRDAGLGPVAVAGSFDVPLGVLAFDYAGVGA